MKKEEGFDRVEELQLAEKICLEPLFVHLYSFYLQGYFNTLRMEVYNKNVGVTMICPGLTYSNLFRNAYRENLETRRDLVLPPTTMKPERCAHLIVIAMANCLDEVWIAKPSRLLELYLAQYLPLVRDWWIQRNNRNRNANLTAASRTN